MSILSKPLAKDTNISVAGVNPIKVAKIKFLKDIPKIAGIMFPSEIGKIGINLNKRSHEKGESLKFFEMFVK
jgi:hypothetical protein